MSSQPDSSDSHHEPPIAVLLGLPFHDLTMEETLLECRHVLETGKPAYFVTANVDFAAQAFENEELRRILFYARRVVCDGMPLIWISKILGHPLRERVAGSDLTPKLLELSAQIGSKVYFFGSDDTALGEVVELLRQRMPGLDIVGFESPPMGQVHEWDNEAVVRRVRAANADVLLVALGCPKQEEWIYQYFKETGASLGIGIGASLDFISGKQIRAPIWMQKTGMEWLWRMGTNPKRLFSRYARDFFFLSWVTMKQWLSKRRRSTNRPASLPSAEPLPSKSVAIQRLAWKGAAERVNVDDLPQPEDWKQPVLLDLSEVDFMDSAGMGALAKLARQARERNQAFGLLSPSESVMSALKAVRLDSLFRFFSDENVFQASLSEITPATDSDEGEEPITIRYELIDTIDRSNVKQLSAELNALIEADPGARTLAIDCSAVNFIDSNGVTALLMARRRMLERNGSLLIVDPSEQLRYVIKLLRLQEFLLEPAAGGAAH
ncbi:MAG: WecB/TagA/CpsF family glycosyltransferase [Verrucomicrobiota bacterium]